MEKHMDTCVYIAASNAWLMKANESMMVPI